MTISSPGIGSNLDVNGIISKLMAAESAGPTQQLNTAEASYQAKLSAYGSLSGALSSFQSSLGNLNNASIFQTLNASSSDSSVFSATASTQAIAGNYNVNITQLAQAQSIASAGQTSSTATIGSGTPTTLTFDFGTINNNTGTGTNLSASVASSGIAANSLSINGTTITTSGATNSAKALAAAINLQSGTTGVTATAAATNTGALGAFTNISTGAGDSYTLNVGGVAIANVGASSSFTAADLDAAIADTTPGSVGAQLAAAGITVSGTAAAGTLQFIKSDGSNIDITQTGTGGAANGGFAGFTSGVTRTTTSSVTLSAASAITIGGSNPSAAGFTAGNLTGFTQDPNRTSGTVTIDNTNNSLQGIRDAINKANLGVTASIISDGSGSPYHLVVQSNTTGASSSMKISVSGDPALAGLLAYDPSGVQNMTQTVAAQSAQLSINGLSISSQSNTITNAIQGITLTAAKTGAASLNVASNAAAVQSNVQAFVQAYNSLTSTIQSLTAYNQDSTQSGPLIGDSGVMIIQSQLSKMISSALAGSSGNLTTLSQIGISIDKTGTMSLDSSKLSSAISSNMKDVTALFSSLGSTSDSLISYVSATSTTPPSNNSQINITQLATQGKLTGSTALPSSTIITSANQNLDVAINGVTTSVSLLAGTYTPAQLATQVQSAINGASAFSSAGIAVSATTDSSGNLIITSNTYGSTSTVSVAGNGASALFGATPVATNGVDVAGTIAGVAASGSGQYLTGAIGSPVSGLKLLVSGGNLGPRGAVTYSQGFAFNLNNLISSFIGTNGLISANTTGIQSSIKDIDNQRTELSTRLAADQANYQKEFTALDVTIGEMNSTSSYLTQQLAQISANSVSSSSKA